jgi:hypothetical protein
MQVITALQPNMLLPGSIELYEPYSSSLGRLIQERHLPPDSSAKLGAKLLMVCADEPDSRNFEPLVTTGQLSTWLLRATLLSSTQLLLGPLVYPGLTACYRCLEELGQRGSGISHNFKGFHDEKLPSQTTLEHFGTFLYTELTRFTQAENFTTGLISPNRYVRFDWLTQKVQVTNITRPSWCPDCGRGEFYPLEVRHQIDYTN